MKSKSLSVTATGGTPVVTVNLAPRPIAAGFELGAKPQNPKLRPDRVFVIKGFADHLDPHAQVHIHTVFK